MKNFTTIYMVRHGETGGNRRGTFVGSTDMPLSDRGVLQARALGAAMADVKIDRIWSSPYIRAKMTAEGLRGERDIPILTDTGLREICCGSWEGLGPEQIEARWPGQLTLWGNRPDELQIEGGDSFLEVRDRAFDAFCRIVRAERGADIAIVSHMLASQLIMTKLLDVPIRDVWQMVRLENTAVTTLRVYDDGHFFVDGWADVSHLPDELRNPSVKVAGIPGETFVPKYTLADAAGEHYMPELDSGSTYKRR